MPPFIADIFNHHPRFYTKTTNFVVVPAAVIVSTCVLKCERWFCSNHHFHAYIVLYDPTDPIGPPLSRCAAIAAAPTAADVRDAQHCQRPFRRLPMIGNGDVLHFTGFERRLDEGGFDAVMIGRCACFCGGISEVSRHFSSCCDWRHVSAVAHVYVFARYIISDFPRFPRIVALCTVCFVRAEAR